MVKRGAEEIVDGNQAYLKRQKIGNTSINHVATEEIRSGKQLRQTLAFDQDNSRAKHGKKMQFKPKQASSLTSNSYTIF